MLSARADSCCADGAKCGKAAVTQKGAELLTQMQSSSGCCAADKPAKKGAASKGLPALPAKPARELTPDRKSVV